GTAEIDASHLVFARGGLQPADVTPIAALLANAQGQAAFTGHMDWNKDQPVEGTGRLVVGRLDFSSPVGPVSGLKGEVAFTSLAPLVSGANQSVTADLIDAFAPLKNVNATFTLAEDGLHLASAQAEVAGGRANLEPMTLPFAQHVTIAGAIGLDDINLNDLVALTSYADRIKTDLILDGRLPFEVDDRGIRLLKGRLATVKPGRISISRELLTGVESGQATAQVQTAPNAAVAEAPATNAVQDLTYDVLENLAVDSLSATVESLPSGRLGALFSIKGRFDPAKAPKTTMPLADLILGKPLDKIPLAKGTPVDLTLDTSLNFDELVKGVESSFNTFKDLHQPSRSGPVQR
ncbi:MAG TPA: YdbH domain-containing protein, partial [Caulobacteraceae bacterium]|nr:YdbH domain-containing protein [Caulobacteraceae bacterium]